MKYTSPCLDCGSKGTFQSHSGRINKLYSIPVIPKMRSAAQRGLWRTSRPPTRLTLRISSRLSCLPPAEAPTPLILAPWWWPWELHWPLALPAVLGWVTYWSWCTCFCRSEFWRVNSEFFSRTRTSWSSWEQVIFGSQIGKISHSISGRPEKVRLSGLPDTW
jgi:hypothetical protein